MLRNFNIIKSWDKSIQWCMCTYVRLPVLPLPLLLKNAHVQARSQGGCGGCDAPPPKSAKRSTFSHKMGQKWGFCRRVRGVRFKKVHFLGPKGPLFGGPAPPKIDPGYGPAHVCRYCCSCCLWCECLVSSLGFLCYFIIILIILHVWHKTLHKEMTYV